MKTNQEYRVKNRVGRDLILMYGPAVRSQEAFGDEEVGSMRKALFETPAPQRRLTPEPPQACGCMVFIVLPLTGTKPYPNS